MLKLRLYTHPTIPSIYFSNTKEREEGYIKDHIGESRSLSRWAKNILYTRRHLRKCWVCCHHWDIRKRLIMLFPPNKGAKPRQKGKNEKWQCGCHQNKGDHARSKNKNGDVITTWLYGCHMIKERG